MNFFFFFFFLGKYINILEEESKKYIYLRANINFLCNSFFFFFLIGGEGAIACSLPSAGDHSNIILGVPRLNHKEWGKFKDNVIKKTIWVKKKSTFAW